MAREMDDDWIPADALSKLKLERQVHDDETEQQLSRRLQDGDAEGHVGAVHRVGLGVLPARGLKLSATAVLAGPAAGR